MKNSQKTLINRQQIILENTNNRRTSARILTAITRKSYSKTDIKFHTQLEADLAANVRGGRKAKLIARSWVAINQKQLILQEYDYLRFRAKWMSRTIYDINQRYGTLINTTDSPIEDNDS